MLEKYPEIGNWFLVFNRGPLTLLCHCRDFKYQLRYSEDICDYK